MQMHIYFTMDLLTSHHADIPSPSSESRTLWACVVGTYPATAAAWERKVADAQCRIDREVRLDQNLLTQIQY